MRPYNGSDTRPSKLNKLSKRLSRFDLDYDIVSDDRGRARQETRDLERQAKEESCQIKGYTP